MKIPQLFGVLFLGDLFADRLQKAWERGEDNVSEYAKVDGYLRYEINGSSMWAELSEDVTSVGSSKEADYCIVGKGVSGRHALFRRDEGQYYIRNVSAEGETFLNDIALDKGEERPIETGSIIRLCGVEMPFLRRPAPSLGSLCGF